jgi:hypothetical protein
MKKLAVLLLLTLGIVLLGGNALAQNVGDKSVFFVTYYSNANYDGSPDAILRLINDGGSSTGLVKDEPNGNLYASIYVFDDSQELQECCNCAISADGLLSEDVYSDLTSNTVTGKVNHVGVIKVISSSSSDPTNNKLQAGLHGTMTHVQNAATYWAVTETPLSDSNLVGPEQTALQNSCSFAISLGSSQGVCLCTQEDSDF